MDRARTLAECERLWFEDGRIDGVLAAVKLCTENNWPLPEWCKRPAMEGLRLLAKEGLRGRAQSIEQKTEMRDIHNRRHNLVCLYVHQGMTLSAAFQRVAEGEGVITAHAVRRSYRIHRSQRAPK